MPKTFKSEEEKQEFLKSLMGVSAYDIDPVEEGKGIFLYGKSGTGKTKMAVTGRRPCFIYEFDIDGAHSIGREKDVEIKYFVDSDPTKPSAYNRWVEHFESALDVGFFERFKGGTIVADGTNSFEMSIHMCLRENKKSIGSMSPKTAATTQPEYNVITINTWDMVNRMLGLRFMYGCDVVVCTHETYQKDEATGRITTLPLMYGQSDHKVFGIFSEAYRMVGERSGNSLKIEALTKVDPSFTAKSRLDNTGKILNFREEPNLTKIFNKIREGRK